MTALRYSFSLFFPVSLSLFLSPHRQHTDGHDLRDYGNENTVILRGDDEITGRSPAYRLKTRTSGKDENKICERPHD